MMVTVGLVFVADELEEKIPVAVATEQAAAVSEQVAAAS